jgi:hypothetical protein
MSLLIAGGCAQRSTVTLYQSFAPPGQQELRLADPRVHVRSEPGHRVIVASFSRPGSVDGSRDFVLYLVAPPREGVLLAGATPESSVRGFLIQTVGTLRGKTGVTDGRLSIRSMPWPRRERYELSFSLFCEDGASIVGRLTAQESVAEAQRFERCFAADTSELTGQDLSEDDAAESASEITPPRALYRDLPKSSGD